MNADFVPVKGYEDYLLINEFGIVKKLARTWKAGSHGATMRFEETIVKPRLCLGYLVFDIHVNGKNKILKVHRLVGINFIPNPDNKPWINHKDLNRANPRKDNLEWSTAKENVNHARQNKTWKRQENYAKGEDSGKAKLLESQVFEIKNSNLKNIELAELYKINPSTVSRIKAGKYWKHLN